MSRRELSLLDRKLILYSVLLASFIPPILAVVSGNTETDRAVPGRVNLLPQCAGAGAENLPGDDVGDLGVASTQGREYVTSTSVAPESAIEYEIRSIGLSADPATADVQVEVRDQLGRALGGATVVASIESGGTVLSIVGSDTTDCRGIAQLDGLPASTSAGIRISGDLPHQDTILKVMLEELTVSVDFECEAGVTSRASFVVPQGRSRVSGLLLRGRSDTSAHTRIGLIAVRDAVCLEYWTRSDRRGVYCLDDVLPGRYSVFAHGLQPLRGELVDSQLQVGSQEFTVVDFEVETRRAYGRVRTVEGGIPIPGAIVYVRRVDEIDEHMRELLADKRTASARPADTAGYYDVTWLATGEYFLVATARNYTPAARVVSLSENEEKRIDFDLHPEDRGEADR